MYRLTIYQADNDRGYIVAEAEKPQQIIEYLESYKNNYDTSKFINYDIIQYDKLLDEKFDLDHIHL